jgi:hypothetical protein
MTTCKSSSFATLAVVLITSVAAGWGLQRAFSQNEGAGTTDDPFDASPGDAAPATATTAASADHAIDPAAEVSRSPQWDKTMTSADSSYDVVPRSQKELTMRAKLQEPVNLQFVDQPLNEAMDDLSHRYALHIELDRNAMQDIGIDTATLVSASYRDMPLETALRLTLEHLKLTHIIHEEYLLITTHDAARERLDTRVYPIRQEWSVDGTELAESIMAVVEPLSWDAKGGTGSVRPLGRYLLVYQTQRVHDEVKDLLRQIDAAAWLENAQNGRPTGNGISGGS